MYRFGENNQLTGLDPWLLRHVDVGASGNHFPPTHWILTMGIPLPPLRPCGVVDWLGDSHNS